MDLVEYTPYSSIKSWGFPNFNLWASILFIHFPNPPKKTLLRVILTMTFQDVYLDIY